MTRFRPFRNTDPPDLCDIWCRQPPQRGLAKLLSPALMEELLLRKLYFDPQGLIVATKDERPVGFVHAGFGATEEGDRLSTEMGVTCMLMVLPEEAEGPLAGELLARSEAYLRERGAKVLYAGEIHPLDPFYLGLYGGSELPGVLDSDAFRQATYLGGGYREIDRVVVLHCGLGGFQAPVDRRQMQLRRTRPVKAKEDPCCRTWWEECTFGGRPRTRFFIDAPDEVASVTFWNLEPLAFSWGTHAAGLIDLRVNEAQRREGLATYLLSEAFRQLRMRGIDIVEVQTMHHNTAALALYKKLGFTEIDQGAVLRKE